jgi:hypothetical protein
MASKDSAKLHVKWLTLPQFLIEPHFLSTLCCTESGYLHVEEVSGWIVAKLAPKVSCSVNDLNKVARSLLASLTLTTLIELLFIGRHVEQLANPFVQL